MISPQNEPIEASPSVKYAGIKPAPIIAPTIVMVTEPGIIVPRIGNDSRKAAMNAKSIPMCGCWCR